VSLSAGQRPNRTERRRLETHERLYQAAVELIAERGFEATTMTDIAERADVGRQTAFNHFPSKGDFTVEWTRRRRARAAEAAGRNTPAEADALERLRAYFHELALTTEEEHQLTRQMMLGWIRSLGPVNDAPWLTHALVPWIEAGRRTGKLLIGANPTVVGDLLRDAYLGVMFRWMREPEYQAGRFTRDLDEAIDLVLRGLRPDQPGP
jgi:AcrR family transcriptional regulator